MPGIMVLSTGVVKWFNAPKGFGFIECDATGAEVFLHCSRVTGNEGLDVAVGDRVEFEVDELQSIGRRARNVRKLELTLAAE